MMIKYCQQWTAALLASLPSVAMTLAAADLCVLSLVGELLEVLVTLATGSLDVINIPTTSFIV